MYEELNHYKCRECDGIFYLDKLSNEKLLVKCVYCDSGDANFIFKAKPFMGFILGNSSYEKVVGDVTHSVIKELE